MMHQSSATPLPFAVVMGLSPTGLHVVRILGRVGVRVIGVADGMQLGRASRYLRGVIAEPDPMRRLEAICALAQETAQGTPGRPVLIPTSDQHVDFVITHAAQLAKYFTFQESYRDGLAAQIMAKDSFYALCSAHGVHYPRLWKTTREGLALLAPHLVFPVMVKPARIHIIKDRMQGQKGWTVTNVASLKSCVAAIPDGVGTLLVQEVVPGSESAITLVCTYVNQRGQMRQTLTARKLRQFPPGFGSASLVQTAPEPESATVTTALLSALGYRGIAAAEFKRHPATGALAMIEVNVRPSLWFSVSDAAKRPLVLSAYRELAGLTDDLPEVPQVQGVRWRYAIKDACSALFYYCNPDFLLPPPDIETVGPASQTIDAVFTPDDPAPLVLEWLHFAGKGLVRMTYGIFRTFQNRRLLSH